MRRIDPYTMDRARPSVGSLGSDERHGLPPQASGSRLPGVSMIASSRSDDRGHAEARPWSPCACEGVIFVESDSDTVERAIERHSVTPRHLLWRLAEQQRVIDDALPPSPYTERDPPLAPDDNAGQP